MNVKYLLYACRHLGKLGSPSDVFISPAGMMILAPQWNPTRIEGLQCQMIAASKRPGVVPKWMPGTLHRTTNRWQISFSSDLFFSPREIETIVTGSFDDNRTWIHYCHDPLLIIDDIGYGTISYLAGLRQVS